MAEHRWVTRPLGFWMAVYGQFRTTSPRSVGHYISLDPGNFALPMNGLRADSFLAFLKPYRRTAWTSSMGLLT